MKLNAPPWCSRNECCQCATRLPVRLRCESCVYYQEAQRPALRPPAQGVRHVNNRTETDAVHAVQRKSD